MAYDPTFGKGSATTSKPPAAAPVGNSYSPTFGGPTTPPAAPASTTPTYFSGGGYGPATSSDPTSGKPFLEYTAPGATSSNVMRDRVATTFDFTKAQPITREMLTNGRMSQASSTALKKQLGGTIADQLDHIMPLELGGSNDTSNMRIEPLAPGSKNTKTDPIENQITQAALQGKISVLDAWHMMAVAKGIGQPQNPDQSWIDKFLGVIGNAANYLKLNNLPVQVAAAIQAKGVVGGLTDVALRTQNQIVSGNARIQKGPDGKMAFHAGNLDSMAIGGLSAPEDLASLIAKSTNPAEIASLLKGTGIDAAHIPALSEQLAKVKSVEDVNRVLQGKPEGTRAASYDPAFTAKPPETPSVQIDEQAQNEAATKTVASKGSGIGGLDKPTAQAYRDWVNKGSHNTQALSGRIASNQFEDLRKGGMDLVHQLQAGETGGRLASVKTFMEDLLTKEQKAGIPVEERANYLPQYWANSQAEVQKAYEKYFGATNGKAISLRPSFTKEVTFPDYATGEAYGLTPRYNNIPDMINARVRASEKALADRGFYDYLTKNNLVQPSNRVGSGWKTLSPDRFPRYAVTLSNGEIYHGTVSAPAPLADLINNQLSTPEGFFEKGLQATANFASKLKNVVLAAGVPGTAINLHGFNELAATVPELFNQPNLFTSALQYLFYPKAGGTFIAENLALAREASQAGLTITAEDHAFDELGRMKIMNGMKDQVGALIRKGTDTLYSMFGKHDFEQMIPALKLKMWGDLKATLIEQGISAVDASRMAAEKANNTFGGVNYAALGRDKNFQNFLRAVIFAPDFWESRLRYAGGMAKSLVSSNDPLASTYRKAVATVIGSYIGMNLWNKHMSGKYMFQNPAGHEMDILMGQDSQGKDIWLRPFGTSLDFIRLPLDIGRSAQQGDLSPVTALFRNRVSTVLQPIVSLVANVDSYGNPIFGPDQYGNPQSIGTQLSKFGSTLPVVPQAASGLAALRDPNKSKLQDISQALSLPVKFNSPATKQDVLRLKADAAEAVRNGDYGPLNELVKNGVIAKNGRAAFIKNAKMTDAQKQKQKSKASTRSKQQLQGAGDVLGL